MIVVHPTGKIDIHNRQRVLSRAVASFCRDPLISDENKELVFRFIEDCRLGFTIRGKCKTRLEPMTCVKHLHGLKLFCHHVRKGFDAVALKDMKRFILQLQEDQILNQKGKPYTHHTKAAIKKGLKKFWKWKDGKNEFYPELVSWLDVSTNRDVSFPLVKREQIEKAIEQTRHLRDKALVMVLFDSGARAEELLNVRLSQQDLFWREDLRCYMIHLKHSKTIPRTVSLPLSTKHLRDWLEVHPLRDDPNAQLFPMNYAAMKMVVNRLFKRACKLGITPRRLRQASATFYANHLNRFELCERYGWSFSSQEPDRYIARAGVMAAEAARTVIDDDVGAARKQSQVLEEQLAMTRESRRSLLEENEILKRRLAESLAGNGVKEVLLRLSTIPTAEE